MDFFFKKNFEDVRFIGSGSYGRVYQVYKYWLYKNKFIY